MAELPPLETRCPPVDPCDEEAANEELRQRLCKELDHMEKEQPLRGTPHYRGHIGAPPRWSRPPERGSRPPARAARRPRRAGGRLAGHIGVNKFVAAPAPNERSKNGSGRPASRRTAAQVRRGDVPRQARARHAAPGQVPPSLRHGHNLKTKWYHIDCMFVNFTRASRKSKTITDLADVEHLDSLSAPDRRRVAELIDAHVAERAESGRRRRGRRVAAAGDGQGRCRAPRRRRPRAPRVPDERPRRDLRRRRGAFVPKRPPGQEKGVNVASTRKARKLRDASDDDGSPPPPKRSRASSSASALDAGKITSILSSLASGDEVSRRRRDGDRGPWVARASVSAPRPLLHVLRARRPTAPPSAGESAVAANALLEIFGAAARPSRTSCSLVRLAVAGVAGAALGFERRATRKASSPVGVRTMTLVSMGSALFTVAGLVVPQGDLGRVAAAAATGVGFLGAGVITVQRDGRSVGGLTTAATIWYAAALGVAAGTGLCFLVALSTVIATPCSACPGGWLRGRPGRLALMCLPSEDADGTGHGGDGGQCC
ncbi:MgtC-like protein [Aureococcus anophagefferens]|nr:MgtC-like protein [Aureococcus anophagefferens]